MIHFKQNFSHVHSSFSKLCHLENEKSFRSEVVRCDKRPYLFQVIFEDCAFGFRKSGEFRIHSGRCQLIRVQVNHPNVIGEPSVNKDYVVSTWACFDVYRLQKVIFRICQWCFCFQVFSRKLQTLRGCLNNFIDTSIWNNLQMTLLTNCVVYRILIFISRVCQPTTPGSFVPEVFKSTFLLSNSISFTKFQITKLFLKKNCDIT